MLHKDILKNMFSRNTVLLTPNDPQIHFSTVVIGTISSVESFDKKLRFKRQNDANSQKGQKGQKRSFLNSKIPYITALTHSFIPHHLRLNPNLNLIGNAMTATAAMLYCIY